MRVEMRTVLRTTHQTPWLLAAALAWLAACSSPTPSTATFDAGSPFFPPGGKVDAAIGSDAAAELVAAATAVEADVLERLARVPVAVALGAAGVAQRVVVVAGGVGVGHRVVAGLVLVGLAIGADAIEVRHRMERRTQLAGIALVETVEIGLQHLLDLRHI